MPERRKLSAHAKILLGFLAGAVSGLLTNQLIGRGVVATERVEWVVQNLTGPLGQIFLNLLLMVVVPLVFCSIALGVAQLGNLRELGRLSVKTFGYFIGTSALASLLGLALVNGLRPGVGFGPEDRARLLEASGVQAQAEATRERAAQEDFWPSVVLDIVSRNPIKDAVEVRMLPVIFTSILFGVALTYLSSKKAAPVLRLLEGIEAAMVVIVGFAMSLAPFAVPALIFNVCALLGVEILRQLSLYVIVVLAGYLIHLFLAYGLLVRLLAGLSPRRFFEKVMPVMVTAFSTSSSSATLPTTIKVCEEELQVPPRLAGFVLPLGATTHMNGTALFVSVVVVFLAQVFGVQLSLGQQALVLVFSVMTAVGAAGVPSGSLPIIVVVLSTMGIPAEGIAIILGPERLLDMGRTVVNVTGDATAACYLAKSEA